MPVFDMVLKADLSKPEIKKIKLVAVSLLQTLEKQMHDVQDDIFSKASTRDRFRQSIYNFLYDNRMGLPVDQYSENDLARKTDQIFGFFEGQISTANWDARSGAAQQQSLGSLMNRCADSSTCPIVAPIHHEPFCN